MRKNKIKQQIENRQSTQTNYYQSMKVYVLTLDKLPITEEQKEKAMIVFLEELLKKVQEHAEGQQQSVEDASTSATLDF